MRTLLLSLIAWSASGCVSQGTYDRAVAQTNTTRAELVRRNADMERMSEDLQQRRAEIARLRSELATTSQLQSAGRDRIATLQGRLGELERAQVAAEARAALYKNLSLRLKNQIDAGDLSIVVRDGRMVLALPNDVLFDTGRTEIKAAGRTALEAIADFLKSFPQRQFQVAGHTDDVPIRNEQFASNWELSTGRALRVVHFLIGKGVAKPSLSAAGYADVDPVASNGTAEGKRRNRRTEITLQPSIDELVTVPE